MGSSTSPGQRLHVRLVLVGACLTAAVVPALVPAETRIIKVDHVQPLPVNDNIVRMKIGVDQTVGRRVFTQRKKYRMDVPSQLIEVGLLGRGE